MTESIKDLLHKEAAPVAFKAPDLGVIAREGGRRIRRRRAAVVLAAVTTVVAVVLAGAVIPRLGNDSPVVPLSPWPSDAVSWASGSKIYVADGSGIKEIEAGHEVRSYVRTATGFVALLFTGLVYSITELGVTQIGQMDDSEPDNKDQPRLVVNSRGTLVGWVDGGVSPESVVLRTYTPLTGSVKDFAGGPVSTNSVTFFAIDDRTMYWRRADGIHEVNLDNGRDRLIATDDIYSFEVYSAESGVLAFSPNDDGTVLAGRSVTGARELHDFSDVRQSSGLSDPVRLSPTGSWLSLGMLEVEPLPGDQMSLKRATPAVFDTTTGERITLTLPGNPPLAIPSIWLDDTTVQVASLGPGPQPAWPTNVMALYRCSLPAGRCELAAEVGKAIFGSGALPDGRWYGP